MINEEILNRIFELISKEDVIFFIGSGMSKCAGLPLGGELSEYVYNELPKEIKEEVKNDKNNLSKISDVYCNEFSREELLNLLENRIYNNTPESSKIHSQLERVTHIKTIITTNYDNLIENAFKSDLLKVVSDEDVSNVTRNNRLIIKIHGDFSKSNTIVITQDDYDSFYTNGLNSPLWAITKERMYTNSVVFLGYSISDGNIKSLIDIANNAFKRNRKEMFFISPQMGKTQEKFLEKRKIQNCTIELEDFFDRLEIYLCSHILNDFIKGKTSTDTTNKFALNQDIQITSRPTINGNEIMDIKPLVPMEQTLTFSTNENILEKLYSECNDQIVIPSEKIINCEIKLGKISFPYQEIISITLIKADNKKIFEIFFTDCSLVLSNLEVKLFNIDNNRTLKAVFKLQAGKITVLFIDLLSFTGKEKYEGKVNVSFEPNDTNDIQAKIEWFTLIANLKLGKEFEIRSDNKSSFKHSFTPNLIGNKYINIWLKHFENLLLISNYYNINFENVNKFSDEDFKNANIICNIINNPILPYKGNGYSEVNLKSDYMLEEQINFTFKENRVINYSKDADYLLLHGISIKIGYRKIIINNPKYKKKLSSYNYEDFLDFYFGANIEDIAFSYIKQNPYEKNGRLKDEYFNE